jgi:hypothetical protein
MDPNQWPDLAIDTAFLHRRYQWNGSIDPLRPPFRPWMPQLGALPQVGWVVRTFDTEVMYLFRSLYGQEHAILSELSFHGRPVCIRLNRGLFRTVHTLFSPMALQTGTGQVFVNGVLSWLYDGRIEPEAGASSSGRAFRDQSVQSVSDHMTDIYWQCYWEANGDRETFHQLLEDAAY